MLQYKCRGNNTSVVLKIYYLILTFLVSCTIASSSSVYPNKLVTYSVPKTQQLKKVLGYNEDTYLNFTELTNKYKYPTEVHTVITEDGYILTVFRILSKCSDAIRPRSVLLMHGITDTSDLWIVSGPKFGLGYILADNCYDVWAANNRGNYYSRRHITLDANKDVRYWNFSFDEYGYYDIPATIDYILAKTGHSKMFYVGHSQGTTEHFIMGSLRPEYNNKIGLAIQLAPIAWMTNPSNSLIVIASQNYKAIKYVLESAGLQELLARDGTEHLLLESLCTKLPRLCEAFLNIATGYKEGTIPLSNITVGFSHIASGCSVKTLAHFAQLVLSGNFQRYDEGIKGNLQRYGTAKPPQYNVSLITSPMVLVNGVSDILSSMVNVKILASKLSRLIEYYIVPRSYWSHHNHVWGNEAAELVYPKILDYFNKF